MPAADRPILRARRELPAEWAAYLATGIRPAAHHDSDRSTLELVATAALVRAGFDEPSAWKAIVTAHPGAFGKSRDRDRHWWARNLWRVAVASCDDFLRDARTRHAQNNSATNRLAVRRGEERVDNHGRARARDDVEQARLVLEEQWRFWPAATRHTDYELARVLLDTMSRRGSTSVATPQRDLLIDSAISTRSTLRASLRRLQEHGFVHVEQTYLRATHDTSNTVHLVTTTGEGLGAGEQEPRRPASPDREEALWWIDPPSFHTPAPLRRHLTPRRTHLLQALRAQAAAPTSLAVLAARAGRLDLHDAGHGAQLAMSPAQHRALLDDLRFLAACELAEVDDTGHWQPVSSRSEAGARSATEALGEAAQTALEIQLAEERLEFRRLLNGDLRRARLVQKQAADNARRLKERAAQQKAWWNGLPTADQEARRRYYQQAFRQLSGPDREQRRAYIAYRLTSPRGAARLPNLPAVPVTDGREPRPVNGGSNVTGRHRDVVDIGLNVGTPHHAGSDGGRVQMPGESQIPGEEVRASHTERKSASDDVVIDLTDASRQSEAVWTPADAQALEELLEHDYWTTMSGPSPGSGVQS